MRRPFHACRRVDLRNPCGRASCEESHEADWKATPLLVQKPIAPHNCSTVQGEIIHEWICSQMSSRAPASMATVVAVDRLKSFPFSPQPPLCCSASLTEFAVQLKSIHAKFRAVPRNNITSLSAADCCNLIAFKHYPSIGDSRLSPSLLPLIDKRSPPTTRSVASRLDRKKGLAYSSATAHYSGHTDLSGSQRAKQSTHPSRRSLPFCKPKAGNSGFDLLRVPPTPRL